MRFFPRLERAYLADFELDDEVYAVAMVWGPLVMRVPGWLSDWLPRFGQFAGVCEDSEEVIYSAYVDWGDWRLVQYTFRAYLPGVRAD